MNVLKIICKYIEKNYKEIRYHTPKEKLTTQEINSIKTNGLIHFTEYKNKASIEEKGILGDLKRSMTRKEKGYTWFYIFDKTTFQEKRDIVLSKGERKKYDAYAIIKELSDEQISYLRIRREIDDAIIYPTSLKTNNIIVYKLPNNRVID